MSKREPTGWITVNGKRVPLFEGESKEEAIKNALGKDNKEKQIEQNKKEADKKNAEEKAKDSDRQKAEDKKAGIIHRTSNYYVKKVEFTSIGRNSRGGGSMRGKTGYELYDKNGNRLEKDDKGYLIGGHRYSTQKEAKQVIENLEKKRK